MTPTTAATAATRFSQSVATPPSVRAGEVATIDCRGVYYRAVNDAVRAAIEAGATTVRLSNVNGQRYIGTGLHGEGVRIEVDGTPGQALAMFMDGPTVEVYGNAQDGVGNTMNSGQVIVHGSVGDVLGYGMRRGRIFVEGDAGYRAGIHMKADEGLAPVIVCGGKARDFFGEYMAGGLLVLLGMHSGRGRPHRRRARRRRHARRRDLHPRRRGGLVLRHRGQREPRHRRREGGPAPRPRRLLPDLRHEPRRGPRGALHAHRPYRLASLRAAVHVPLSRRRRSPTLAPSPRGSRLPAQGVCV